MANTTDVVPDLIDLLSDFVRERDAVMLALDKDAIMDFMCKNRISLPDNEQDFWAGVHMARMQIISMPESAKEISEQWLRNNGYSVPVV